MSNPTGEKNGRGCLTDIGRTEKEGFIMEIVANVINGHNNHYNSPKKVNRLDSRFRKFFIIKVNSDERAGVSHNEWIWFYFKTSLTQHFFSRIPIGEKVPNIETRLPAFGFMD